MLVSVKSVPAEVDSVEHVMASLPVTVKVMVVDVEVEGLAANVTVGAVVSGDVMVIVDASEFAVGPTLPAESVTLVAASRATTVPSLEHVTETVMLVPEIALGVNTQPVAVPASLLKSSAAMPLTDSLNAKV
jgi:hypothetical protein